MTSSFDLLTPVCNKCENKVSTDGLKTFHDKFVHGSLSLQNLGLMRTYLNMMILFGQMILTYNQGEY